MKGGFTMSDQTMQLLQLLKEGKTCNEICSILNLSNKQLFNNLTNLKNKGFLVSPKYYSNGVISYQSIFLVSELNNYLRKKQNVSIITSPKETELKCLVISDLHFGNSLERLDLVDKAFDYCIKNGIHIIFCCGDMIDGTFTQGSQNIEDTFLQIEHFMKDYPFDKNILTFGVAGNHDVSALTNNAQSIIEIAKSYRHDIIIGGFNNTIIDIKNDNILLYHHTNGGGVLLPTAPIILHGHAHRYCIDIKDENTLEVTVPSLSDINDSFPTAVELSLNFQKGYIDTVHLKQIFFGEKTYILSEADYDLLKNRDMPIKSISNEEETRIEYLNNTSTTNQEQMETGESRKLRQQPSSQIEKFNKKYKDFL